MDAASTTFFIFSFLLLSLCVPNTASSRPSGFEEWKDSRWHSEHNKQQQESVRNPIPPEEAFQQVQSTNLVIDATVSCTKTCNYRPFFGDEGDCFGSFVSDCYISQYFAAGHILETRILVNCIGSFSNNTLHDRDWAEIRTLCDGQFEQSQEIHVYKPVESGSIGGESLMTFGMTDTFHTAYSCRHKFSLSRKLQMKPFQKPLLLSGNVQMSCEYEQSIQIQKGLCICTDNENDSCSPAYHKVFNLTAKANTSFQSRRTENHRAQSEPEKSDPVAENFKKIAEHDPDLARRVAATIFESIIADPPTNVNISDVSPTILEYHSKQTIHIHNDDDQHLSASNHPSSWRNVLCNGRGSAFASDCNGRLSANVHLGQLGSALVVCNGEWQAYEDVTYICRGEFTEDETEQNESGTFFSKVSQCSGAAAISPVVTKLNGGIQYHGLSEFCNGRTTLHSSYSLAELDHRYVAQTIDPRTAEQVICLMANGNCEQLRYMI